MQRPDALFTFLFGGEAQDVDVVHVFGEEVALVNGQKVRGRFGFRGLDQFGDVDDRPIAPIADGVAPDLFLGVE